MKSERFQKVHESKEHSSTRDLTRCFGICDLEKPILTFPPLSILSLPFILILDKDRFAEMFQAADILIHWLIRHTGEKVYEVQILVSPKSVSLLVIVLSCPLIGSFSSSTANQRAAQNNCYKEPYFGVPRFIFLKLCYFSNQQGCWLSVKHTYYKLFHYFVDAFGTILILRQQRTVWV